MKFLTLASFALAINGNAAESIFSNHNTEEAINIGPVECTVYFREYLAIDPEKQDVKAPDRICELDSSAGDGTMEGIAYILHGLDEKFFDTVVFGETKLSIESATVSGDILKVLPEASGEPSATVLEGKNNQARRSPLTGTSTLLILYVIPLDFTNDAVTYEEMGDKVFGTGGDAVNARSQILQCSKNQLNYIPACSRPQDSCYGDSDFLHGVFKVPLSTYKVAGIPSSIIVNYSMAAANQMFRWKDPGLSISSFTQVMVVIPNEADWGGAAAWAYLSGTVSAFNDNYAYRMGVLVHEFGHNLGFAHSGYGSASYADHSCLMGNPSYGDDGPQICWNGAKSWESTWYATDSVSVDVLNGEHFNGDIIGVADWVDDNFTPGQHRVVIQIPDPTDYAEDYYVIFNRKKGPNNGVTFFPDQVHVTRGKYKVTSWHKDHLATGGIYTSSDFGNSGYDLKVEVCDIDYSANGPDTANVLVYLDNDRNDPLCGVAPPPTPPATPAPTSPKPTCRSVGTLKYLRTKVCKGRGNRRQAKFARYWKMLPGGKEVLNKTCRWFPCRNRDCCALGPPRKCTNTGNKGLINGGFTQKMCGKRKLKKPVALSKAACTAKDGFRCTKANCCAKK